MPQVPEKSELRRSAEKPEMYPFSTIPVSELERAMLLKTIEDQFNSKEPDFEWNFLERCIEEKYPKKGLIQELADSILWEPDMITKYFNRDDSLLLAIYQKLPADKSYNRQWKAPYRTMPDFSNWLEHFNNNSESKMPLYDIDDNKVGQIRELTQNLTPANGGFLRIKKANIGMDELNQIECFKDGLIFGINRKTDESDLSDYFWVHYDRNTRLDFRQIQGIDRYITSPYEESQAENSPNDDNAPVPDDEEAERLRKEQEAEEKAKHEEERQKSLHQEYSSYRMNGSAATLAYNNGNMIRLLPNGYVMQSKNKVQRDLSENPDKDHQENEEESRVITSKSIICYMTNGKIEIMYANGNYSEYDPSTDLWTITNNQGRRRCKRQSDGHEYDIEPIPAAIETCAETEAQVLFREDNVISILYQNGTRYTIHHDGTKIITNSDETEIAFEKIGYSLVKVLSGRMLEQPDNVPNSHSSDADAEFYDSLLTTRNYLKDRVKGGQIIQTYLHDKSVIQSFIEVNEFGQEKHDMTGELQMEGTIEGEHREETKQQTPADGEGENHPEGEGEIHHAPEEEGPYYQAVHLIRKHDLSVTKVTGDGEVCLISEPTREELNKNGNIMKMGKDFDYLHQLFEIRPQERSGGIFTCSLGKSNIITHDKERNFFAVKADGTFEKVLAPEISEVDEYEDQNIEEGEGGSSKDIIDEQFPQDSHRSRGKTVVPKVDIDKAKGQQKGILPVAPRIFCIYEDGTGSEFFTKDHMDAETGRFGSDVIIVKSTEFINENPVLMHSYFHHLKTDEEIDEELSVVAKLQEKKIADCKTIDDIAIPKNVEEYPQVFRPLVDKPKSKIYLFRNYMQHKDFDQFKTSAFYEDMARYKKWKEEIDAPANRRFGINGKDEEIKSSDVDKRIITKIYRERQNPRQEVQYKQIKDMRLNAVTNEMRKVGSQQKSEHVKVVDQPTRKEFSSKSIVEDPNASMLEKEDEGEEQDAEKAAEPPSGTILGEDELPRKRRTQEIMEEINSLKQEPYFLPNYYETHSGKAFVRENPPKPPNEEVLMRMSQRMSRSIGATEGEHGRSHDGDRLSAYSQHKELDERNKAGELGSYRDAQEDNINKDNPIVALEPEDDENRDQMRMSGMKQSQRPSQMDGELDEPNYVPSMYNQEKGYLKRKEEEELLKAEEYHVSKTKEFNVYGRLRPLKPKVKSLAKSKAKSEMNEKFITTESITDKRIKISSMANRPYMVAPDVEKVRKQGQHQMILNAISKKQTFNELISQANAMVTSVLNDPLKRSVNILPSQVTFGSLKEGSKYQVEVTCKNEDMLPQRVSVRQAKDKRIKIAQDKGGPIAPGMVKRITVTINANLQGESSVISDGFEIITKTDIYRIPITATIFNEEKFEEINAESFKIYNKPAMKSTVREVQDPQRSTVSDQLQKVEGNRWVETTGSESKLPSLPNIKNRAFEPDAQKGLDEVIEKSSRASSRRNLDSANASRQSKRSIQSKRSYLE